MPATALRVIQLGHETTFGTHTKATVLLQGVTDASMTPMVAIDQPGVLIGRLAPSSVAEIGSLHGEATVEQRLSYQDICYWLDGMFGEDASSKAANTIYVREYAAPNTTAVTPHFYSMQYGVGTDAPYEMISSLTSQVGISGEAGGMWEGSIELMGYAVQTAVLTTSLSVRGVDLIRMSDTNFYMDAWTSQTLGMTEVGATLISFELNANSQTHLKQFAGSYYPGDHGQDRWEGTLSTVLEFNSTAKGVADALLAPAVVQRLIRIQSTTGASTKARLARIDFAGTLAEGYELFSDRDGNVTIDLTWNGTYNSTMGNWLEMRVENELDAMP